jgi:hypothetical protein
MYPEWHPATPWQGSAAERSAGAGQARECTVDQRLVREVALALLDDPAVTDGFVDLHVQNGIAILQSKRVRCSGRHRRVATAVGPVASAAGLR